MLHLVLNNFILKLAFDKCRNGRSDGGGVQPNIRYVVPNLMMLSDMGFFFNEIENFKEEKHLR